MMMALMPCTPVSSRTSNVPAVMGVAAAWAPLGVTSPVCTLKVPPVVVFKMVTVAPWRSVSVIPSPALMLMLIFDKQCLKVSWTVPDVLETGLFAGAPTIKSLAL